MGFESFANGVKGGTAFGVSHVRIWCEGNYVDVSEEAFHRFQDVNGNPTNWFGFNAAVDISAAVAMSSTGTIALYAESVPNDPSMQRRVIGPILLHPRTGLQAAPWGGPAIYDALIEVNEDLPPNGSTRFLNLATALTYAGASATRKLHPLIYLSKTGDYPFSRAGSAGIVSLTDFYTTIAAAPGITARIVRGDQTAVAPRYDGIRFMGAGVIFDRGRMCETSGLAFSSSGRSMVWLDGVELTATANSNCTGSGASILYNGAPLATEYMRNGNNTTTAPTNFMFTECFIHDMPGTGVAGASLIRGCLFDLIGGSCIQGLGSPGTSIVGLNAQRWNAAAHNNTVKNVNQVLAQMRTWKEAGRITYAGSMPNMGWAKKGANGLAGEFQAVQSFTASIASAGLGNNQNRMTVTAAPPNVTLQVGTAV